MQFGDGHPDGCALISHGMTHYRHLERRTFRS